MQIGAGQLKHLIFALLTVAFGQAALAEPSLREVSNFEWDHPAPWFGGLSGIEVAADGASATIINDKGNLLRARFQRTKGQITGVSLQSRTKMRRPNGAPLKGDERDTEGLAIAANKKTYVSFEFRDRVTTFAPASGITTSLPRHKDFETFNTNSGLEALAIHPDGTLYALPERPPPSTKMTPIYRFDGTSWRIAYHLPPRGAYLPVGADFAADGRLYLLERALTPLGFSSRIRRLTLGAQSAKAETLTTTLPGAYDNLEGISVWTDATGATRLTLVSDDNFLALQRTQIVEFTLTE